MLSVTVSTEEYHLIVAKPRIIQLVPRHGSVIIRLKALGGGQFRPLSDAQRSARPDAGVCGVQCREPDKPDAGRH